MVRRGKKYQEAVKLVEGGKLYPPGEAVELAKEAAYANFDESVEIHLRMGLDPRRADQQVRGTVVLPHGLGKEQKILVFAEGDALKTAHESGADYVGGGDLIKRIEEGWLGFDVAIATPEIMGKVGKLGRILGRRGLMPNPKAGTVVAPPDLGRAIQNARKGQVEYRLDRAGIIHVPVGKISFEVGKLLENIAMVVEAVVKAKPSGAKGEYVRGITLSTSMGPGIKLDLKPALSLSTV